MIKHSFTDQDAVLPTFFPNVLLRLLFKQGINTKLVLTHSNLGHINFEDETQKLSFNQLKKFLASAIDLSGDPHLGWRFGEHINVTSLGMVGYAAMSCASLRQALQTIAQYFKIRDPIYELSLVTPDDGRSSTAIQIDESLNFNEQRYFLLSSATSGAASLVRYYSNRPDIVLNAELSCPEPENWRCSAPILDYELEFNAPYTRLYFDSTYLDLPIPTADPLTEKSTKEICKQLLAMVEGQSGIVGKVREFILSQAGDYPGLEDTATHFCVSSRTLRRELAKSGTTYQQVLDNVREKIALEYLVKSTKPIQEIAYELGFNDLSNFGRAFKRWTGKAPSQFRP